MDIKYLARFVARKMGSLSHRKQRVSEPKWTPRWVNKQKAQLQIKAKDGEQVSYKW